MEEIIQELACTRFRVGQRVQKTAAYPEHWRQREVSKATTGTVIGFSRCGEMVRVRRDGAKAIENFQVEYWEPEHSPS